MIITSTGFYNTGSSAVTNILQEFASIESSGDVNEIRLLYDTDSISDLEYNLIENPHRHNTSNAIKRFIKFVEFNSNPLFNHHYENIFNGKFKTFSNEYVTDICDFDYFASYFGDYYNKGAFFYFANRVYQKIRRIFAARIKFVNKFPYSLVSKKEKSYAGTFDEEKFLQATKKYVKKLLSEYNKNKKSVILIDQFLPPTNINRYLRYLPEDEKCKTFIVDRDPRDLYFATKYFFPSEVMPVYNVEVFCNWFLWTRKQSEKFSYGDSVMRIQFEDLIYKYDEMRTKICNFIGIDSESECKKFANFNPKESVNNTQTWRRIKNINKSDLDYIEKKLAHYCYDFDNLPENSIKPDFDHFNLFER